MYKERVSVLASPEKHKKAVQALHAEGKTHTKEYDKWLDEILKNKKTVVLVFLITLGVVFGGDKVVEYAKEKATRYLVAPCSLVYVDEGC